MTTEFNKTNFVSLNSNLKKKRETLKINFAFIVNRLLEITEMTSAFNRSIDQAGPSGTVKRSRLNTRFEIFARNYEISNISKKSVKNSENQSEISQFGTFDEGSSCGRGQMCTS